MTLTDGLTGIVDHPWIFLLLLPLFLLAIFGCAFAFVSWWAKQEAEREDERKRHIARTIHAFDERSHIPRASGLHSKRVN